MGARAQSRGLRAAAESLEPGDIERATVAEWAMALWSQSHDFEVRYRLMPALVGAAEGRAVLREALAHDRDGDLRAEAARVLRGRVLASDPWPSVRVAAVNALAGDIAASAMLTNALGQRYFTVVRAALVALGTTPGEAVGTALVAFADNDWHNPELRQTFARAS